MLAKNNHKPAHGIGSILTEFPRDTADLKSGIIGLRA